MAEHADGAPLPLVRDLKVHAPERRRLLPVRAQHGQGRWRRTSRRRPSASTPSKPPSKRRSSTTAWRYEREIFIALMFTPECKALRHAFFGRARRQQDPRRARGHAAAQDRARWPSSAPAPWAAASRMNFLNAGIPVTMLEMKQEALDRGVATIRKNYEAQVKKGKLKQDKYEQRMALLSTTLSYDDLDGRRPGDRGRVRGDGRQGEGLQARSTR
ncbi:MAG: 3-hydroxyacyl-CoA dehydrogenase NAD-binding domain-containing protein [Comamonadaceae bacterium]|nr:3-hydroxyacyl-CoA dehydrogenase NAD-binding domain-containing protein [Comamonadaceae bacterium]